VVFNLRANVFSKSSTGLSPLDINKLLITAGFRLLGLLTRPVYKLLAPLNGSAPPVVAAIEAVLYGFGSPKSMKPTISLASVVAPVGLVTHTSMR